MDPESPGQSKNMQRVKVKMKINEMMYDFSQFLQVLDARTSVNITELA